MDDEVELLVSALRAHLARHPQAADKLAGICRRWIPQDKAYPPEAVREAIEMLVRLGEVQPRTAPEGSIIYTKRGRD
jgi:hypothetical protein